MKGDKGGVSRRDFMRLAAATAAGLTLCSPGGMTAAALASAAAKDKEQFPVVVIGAGLGGLSAAAHLARAGFPVTLVEQHDQVGGYASTFDRGAGRYTFDVSLHATGSATGQLRPILEGAGVADTVQTVELPELCRILTPDHDFTWPQRNPNAVAEELARAYPGEAAGIKGFFDEMMGVLDEMETPFNPESTSDRLLFPATHKRVWAMRDQTLSEVMDRYARSPRVRSLLSVFWPYYGLPPSRLSAFFYCIATASYLRYGGHYVKTRSRDLSNALAGSVEKAGGRVLLESEVEAILMKEGEVAGVRLDDGRTINARAVISNAGIPTTLGMLPAEAVPSDYRERLKNCKPSISTFVVWLGLNREIRNTVKGYEIFVMTGYDPEKAYQANLACNPEETGIGVTVYDNAFKGYSRPGASTVSIIALSGYEPWRRFEADYLAGRKEEYSREKERITRILVSRAEKLVIPGLSSMIEVMEASTPLTNMRFTKNPEGAVYGYEQSPGNSFMTRMGNRSPVKGLYFASAWSDPGGGYQPCLQSGLQAFNALVKDWSGSA